MSKNEDTSPVGFMGKLRSMKGLTWLVIISLLILTLGGSAILFLVGIFHF